MNYLGNKSLLQLLKSTEYDFVAFVMTPWHAHSFIAALKNIENVEKRSLKGIVIIKPHLIDGWLLNESDFTERKNLISVYRYRDDETYFDRLKSEIGGILYYFGLKKNDGPAFYFFKPNGFRYPILSTLQKACGKDKSVYAVSIDEGVGIYTNFNFETFGNAIKSSITQKTSLKNKLFSIFKTFETYVFTENRLKLKGHYIDCNLMKIRTDGVCEPNGNMPKYFKEAVEEFNKADIYYPRINNKYILINTQPIEEYTYSEKDIQFEILKECIPIFKESGYLVVLKPHPRERNIKKYKSLDVLLFENNAISQESLLCNMKKPEYIVSCCSTTLVSTHLFWETKSISLIKLFINTGKMSKHYKEILNRFEIAFQEILLFPEDNAEIRQILNQTKSRVI